MSLVPGTLRTNCSEKDALTLYPDIEPSALRPDLEDELWGEGLPPHLPPRPHWAAVSGSCCSPSPLLQAQGWLQQWAWSIQTEPKTVSHFSAAVGKWRRLPRWRREERWRPPPSSATLLNTRSLESTPYEIYVVQWIYKIVGSPVRRGWRAWKECRWRENNQVRWTLFKWFKFVICFLNFLEIVQIFELSTNGWNFEYIFKNFPKMVQI